MSIDTLQIRKYVGNMAQIADIREMTIETGRSRGMRVYQVQTGNGLEFDLLPDRAMDIMRLTYRGVNINWQAKTGFTSPVYTYPVLNEFDRYFSGGMLMTAGLKNTGPDYIDPDGRFQPLHGRLNMLPCEQSWHRCFFTDDDYILEAGGTVRDALLCSHNLTLSRVVRTSFSRAEIEIEDTLENHEPEETDYVILYHMNFGYPFISPALEMGIPEGTKPVMPRTEWAEKGMDSWNIMEPPIDAYEEQCYFHHLAPEADGFSRVTLKNPEAGVAVVLAYEAEHLPILTEWKSVRSGEYVLGVEPGNSYISGMDNERAHGRVDRIGPFEKRVFRVKLSFSPC